jgi:hypothetical protein
MDRRKDSAQVQRLEVVEFGRRRRWSAEAKLRIVEESFAGWRSTRPSGGRRETRYGKRGLSRLGARLCGSVQSGLPAGLGAAGPAFATDHAALRYRGTERSAVSIREGWYFAASACRTVGPITGQTNTGATVASAPWPASTQPNERAATIPRNRSRRQSRRRPRPSSPAPATPGAAPCGISCGALDTASPAAPIHRRGLISP